MFGNTPGTISVTKWIRDRNGNPIKKVSVTNKKDSEVLSRHNNGIDNLNKQIKNGKVTLAEVLKQ